MYLTFPPISSFFFWLLYFLFASNPNFKFLEPLFFLVKNLVLKIPIMASTDELYTRRIDGPRQDLSDAYSLPANFLEIEVINPETHGIGWRQKYTDYEVKMKVRIL